jgi:hypothetical protein
MECGFDFGMADLTPEELADCFDAICDCGKEHSPENLRKLRTRILELVKKLSSFEGGS